MFKTFLVPNPDLLEKLVPALLAIPLESISQFEIINTEIPPEYMGGKYEDLPRIVVRQDEPALFELQKLPADELDISNKLLLWLALFKADTEEELERIKKGFFQFLEGMP